MDFQSILQKLKAILIAIGHGLQRFWQFIKPHLSAFHQARKRIWKKYYINKIFLLLMLVAVLVTSVYLFILAKSVDVSTLEANLKQSTAIYDENNEEAGTLYDQKGTYVENDEISDYVKEAVVSTEDRNFYTHHGFDIKGIARAALGFLTSGHITGGGSTITQQLAKNAYLSQDQTIQRKAKELFMALEIEKKYSKSEILTMYLNNSYFGNGVWGVEDAAEKYFGVHANELTIGEAATIAGMLKGPSIYNPIDNLENATNRRDTVLGLMVETGKITSAEETEQTNISLSSLLQDNYSSSDAGYSYPSYFDAVINEAVDRYGISEKNLLNNGYKIYTTLNQDYQKQMQAVYDNSNNFPAAASDGVDPQSASVAVNPNNGGVQALVGRRGEHVFREYNLATQMQRSPGSTLKPLSVYVPALELGYSPSSTLQDEPQSYYSAKNSSGTYSGEVPMYQAVAKSLNLPAIWLLHEIGLNKGYKSVARFGIDLADSDKYYGLALGGLENGVSPLQMAAAYATFANGGKYYEPYLITKIIDSNGKVIVDHTDPTYDQVISEKVANEMTSMLLGVFTDGTASVANPTGYTVAGKTGTTETNFDVTKVNDQWIIGYTPNIVISTWLGFENVSETHYLTENSASQAGQVFKAEAEAILPYVESAEFPVANAYTTGGEVMTPAEANAQSSESSESSSDSSGSWQDTLKEYGDKASAGIDSAVEKAKEGVNKIWEKIQGN